MWEMVNIWYVFVAFPYLTYQSSLEICMRRFINALTLDKINENTKIHVYKQKHVYECSLSHRLI